MDKRHREFCSPLFFFFLLLFLVETSFGPYCILKYKQMPLCCCPSKMLTYILQKHPNNDSKNEQEKVLTLKTTPTH